MSDAVLDSSALLALLLAETGAEAVTTVLPGALLSTVNLAEVVAKLAERGMPAPDAMSAIRLTGIVAVDFTAEQASLAGALRVQTRGAGLSLGDRACLALARVRGLPAFTADGAWKRISGFDIIVIDRGSPRGNDVAEEGQ